MFSPYTKTGRGRKKDRERKMGRVGGRERKRERVEDGLPAYTSRELGIRKPWAAAEVSRLGLALHFARRTYSNRFARIRATKSHGRRTWDLHW